MKAILKNNKVVIMDNAKLWKEWMLRAQKTKERLIKQDVIKNVLVSTVFLGQNRNFSSGKPHWFESMIFIDEKEWERQKYTTYEEAIKGHEKMVQYIQDRDSLEL